jgi:hypothetical protein
MVERDRLERRDYKPTTPTDTEDPPQFGQVLETAKDAFVEELRQFFNQPNLNVTEPERREEIPTVRKYAVGFAPGTDPYETVQQIVTDFADTKEALPHVAVTAVQGTNNRLTAGQPFIAHVQLPPRVEGSAAEPYALLGAAVEEWTVVVDTAVVGFRYVVELNTQDFAYVALAGDGTQEIAAGLRDALRSAEPLVSISRTGSTLTIKAVEANVAFTSLTSSANTTATQVQAAGSPGGPETLELRTTPDRQNPETETVVFRADRFPTANPVTAARAVDVARVINEQALNVRAKVVDVGGSPGVRIQTGGKFGQRTPNEIEVLSGTSANLLAVLGLGTSAVGAGPDTITGSPPDTNMTLSATGVGTAALAATAAGVDTYITLSGLGSPGNNGRFRIVSVPGADSVEYENAFGAPESFTGATWFIGQRDSWRNPARPVMNRRHLSMRLTVSVSVLAEDSNERDELHDLVLNQFAYYLEEKHFQIYGRTIFDEDFPDENYQISIAQEVSPAGQQTIPRQEDGKGPIYEARVSIGCTLFWYQDRAVLVPSGPRAGESWVITSADVVPRDNGTVLNDFQT